MVCLIVLAIAGCGAGRSKPVADSTMVDVLVEMHILNARIQITDRPVVGALDSIYSRYGIDSTTFARAMAYYAEYADEYAEVYSRVVDELASGRAPISGPDSILAQPGLTPLSR